MSTGGDYLPLLESSNGASDYSNTLVIGFLVVLGIGMLVLGLFAAEKKGGIKQSLTGIGDIGIDNLFLGVSFQKSSDQRFQASAVKKVVGKTVGPKLVHNISTNSPGLGYLRSLRLGEASFVSPNQFGRAENLNLHLNSLPNFPSVDSVVNGEVISCRSMAGKPESFLVRLKFDPSFVKEDLSKYISRLSNNSNALNKNK